MSLLDDIADIIGTEIPAAGLTRPAVLIKVTEGTATPGQVSGGSNPVLTTFAAQGIEASLGALQLAGTLIPGVQIAINLFATTIAGAQVPAPGDRITIQGQTYTIVDGGVDRDAAAAVYACQCRA